MTANNTNILLVEDNRGDARLIREELEEALTGKFSLVHADCLETCVKFLEQREFDVILLDLGLPDSQGFDTLARVKAKTERHPIVILTGLDSEDMAIKALREGAQDYLVKDEINARILKRAIQYSIERKKAGKHYTKARKNTACWLSPCKRGSGLLMRTPAPPSPTGEWRRCSGIPWRK